MQFIAEMNMMELYSNIQDKEIITARYRSDERGITMADTTYNKVVSFIDRYQMIRAGDLVAAGVSGGADSVCLLHILWRLSKQMPYRLLAVHVDHGVRAESSRDAAYVQQLCKTMEIPFYLHNADMNGYAAVHGISAEEAGRQIRYHAFDQVLAEKRQGSQRCLTAVAHNANDRAETMLFHLFRGSGIKGLGSIQPVRGSVIRPLLCLERVQIEQYLAMQGLDYCLDSTNEEDGYTRNRIRHHILTYAEQEICVGAVAHMGELADILSETESYLGKQAEKLYGIYVEEIAPQRAAPDKRQAADAEQTAVPERLVVRGRELLSEDPVMYKRVLLICMERLVPYRKDITGQHITDLVRLIGRDGSRQLSLPYGIRARKEYDRLFLYREPEEDAVQAAEDMDYGAALKEYVVEPPMDVLVPEEGTYTFTLLDDDAVFCKKQQNIPENRYTKWLDYDKITTSVLLRTRRQGDYLTIDTALHKKSVKEYMINEKIPKSRRDSMYILADGPHIMWVPGYRISQNYKVDENTRRILQVQLRGGFHGGTNRSTVE